MGYGGGGAPPVDQSSNGDGGCFGGIWLGFIIIGLAAVWLLGIPDRVREAEATQPPIPTPAATEILSDLSPSQEGCSKGQIVSALFIRNGPSKSSDEIGWLDEGSEVTVLDCTPIEADGVPWIKIQVIPEGETETVIGYINPSCHQRNFENHQHFNTVRIGKNQLAVRRNADGDRNYNGVCHL